ncbi:agmatinase [Ferrimonas kyonanensis]|uniref:agmatinase n=1 Tax=Ferrimonas kyonanensis TaxID=364763 RepID=UPI000414E3F8|nr:agmatinase [Ferrimonas kyonanensis]
MATLADKKDYSLYSNAFGFLRHPLEFRPAQSKADWVVTGVPFDLATTGRPGSRNGPDAIRRASVNLAWEDQRYPWRFALADRLSVVDCGDLVFDCGDAEQLLQGLETHASALLDADKRMLTFGGDHFVTLPLLRAHAKKFGQLALVHFDAHTDTYSMGSRYDHGTMFYHAPKEGLLATEHSIQIGIRTEYDYQDHPFEVLTADRANDLSADEIAAQIIARVGDRPVYLTFDIDCLDPAYAPGTGTPVCGGMTTDKVLKVLRKLTELPIVGMDVVEVAPAYDHAETTALAAATIATELLYVVAHQK